MNVVHRPDSSYLGLAGGHLNRKGFAHEIGTAPRLYPDRLQVPAFSQPLTGSNRVP